MFRRICRWLALALLALCIVAWVGSYRSAGFLGYVSRTITYFTIINSGRVAIDYGRYPMVSLGWHMDVSPAFAWHDLRPSSKLELAGFAIYTSRPGVALTIPIWFITILLAILALFLWQKPRGKGGGFPVEAREKQSTPT